MPTGSTIAAPCTAIGKSARAMIRVSGDQARSVVSEFTQTKLDSRGVYRADFRFIDERSISVWILWYPGPNSYTGEDTIEIVLPGNQTLVRKVMDTILEHDGVEYAQPGEFSARAYLNHRLTLQQAEGIALRIAAEHEDTLRAASSLLDGSYGQSCQLWVDEMASLLALVEAGVDFSDQEDVVPITPRKLMDRLEILLGQINTQIGSSKGDRVHDGNPEVVFVGKPNAGKSSLFNALLGTNRSMVSDRAGTTRDVIREPLDLSKDIPGSGLVTLLDIAGLDRDAIDALDSLGQEQARKAVSKATLAIWCDPSARFDQHDLDLFHVPKACSLLRVRTKSDLPGNDSTGSMLKVSAFDPITIDVLKRAIADSASNHTGEGVGVFVPRHRRALLVAQQGIVSAIQRVQPDEHSIDEPELIALGLVQSLEALGELVGEVSPDDIIGRVFSTFCVGK